MKKYLLFLFLFLTIPFFSYASDVPSEWHYSGYNNEYLDASGGILCVSAPGYATTTPWQLYWFYADSGTQVKSSYSGGTGNCIDVASYGGFTGLTLVVSAEVGTCDGKTMKQCEAVIPQWTEREGYFDKGLWLSLFYWDPTLSEIMWPSYADYYKKYTSLSANVFLAKMAQAKSMSNALTPSGVGTWMSSQFILVLGSAFGFLLVIFPYVLVIIMIGAIVYFIYRGFVMLRN